MRVGPAWHHHSRPCLQIMLKESAPEVPNRLMVLPDPNPGLRVPGVPRKEAGTAAEQAQEVEDFRLSKLLASRLWLL